AANKPIDSAASIVDMTVCPLYRIYNFAMPLASRARNRMHDGGFIFLWAMPRPMTCRQRRWAAADVIRPAMGRLAGRWLQAWRRRMQIEDQTILITGSTDGVGRRVAERLGAQGARVLVHGRNGARGEEV